MRSFMLKCHPQNSASLARHRLFARLELIVQSHEPRPYTVAETEDLVERRPVFIVDWNLRMRLKL